MLKMLKSQNPDKDYPSNTGQKWTDEEETLYNKWAKLLKALLG